MASVKTVLGLALASMKTFDGLAAANVKTIVGVNATSPAAGPTYNSLCIAETRYFENSSSRAFAVGSTVAVGQRLVCLNVFENGGVTLTSMTDSKGNTYTIDVAEGAQAIASSVITTQLTTSDTVTANYSSTFNQWKGMEAVIVDGSTSVGGTATKTTFGTDATVTPVATASACVICAAGAVNGNGLSSVTGTAFGTFYNYGNLFMQGVYINQTGAGTVTIGATMSLDSLRVIAVCYQ